MGGKDNKYLDYWTICAKPHKRVVFLIVIKANFVVRNVTYYDKEQLSLRNATHRAGVADIETDSPRRLNQQHCRRDGPQTEYHNVVSQKAARQIQSALSSRADTQGRRAAYH